MCSIKKLGELEGLGTKLGTCTRQVALDILRVGVGGHFAGDIFHF